MTPSNNTQKTCKPSIFRLTTISLLLSFALVGCSSNPAKNVYRGPEKTEQQYYEAATTAMRRMQFEAATTQLKALDTYFPTGRYTEHAQLDLMYAYFKQGDFLNAAATADKFTKLYPQNSQIDYAMYLAIVSYMSESTGQMKQFFKQNIAVRDLKNFQTAYLMAQTFTNQFPQSPYYNDVVQRMRYIRNLHAQKEIATAIYSLERHAYLAAVQRADFVINSFQNSPYTADAFEIMTLAYEGLKDTNKAEYYQTLLAKNFPDYRSQYRGNINSRFADKLVKKLTESFNKTSSSVNLEEPTSTNP